MATIADIRTATRQKRQKIKNAAIDRLESIINDPEASPSAVLKASTELRKLTSTIKRKAKNEKARIEPLSERDIEEMLEAMSYEPDLDGLVYRARKHKDTGHKLFLDELKTLCERNLYYFCKFILGYRLLTPTLHKEVCSWLQDLTQYRHKLLMLPVDHFKTSVTSRAIPIHMLIQPAEHNVWFKGKLGCNTRILLAGETLGKAQENLQVLSEQFKQNKWLRFLWPNVCWADPDNEANRWTNTKIEVRRTAILAEPSITALGVGGDLHGRHYDCIIMDDIITLKAAQSPQLMKTAHDWRVTVRSRLDGMYSIELGVGTHWGIDDIYVEWQKDPTVDVMRRSAIENGEPLFPERYSLDFLNQLRTSNQMGDIWFSLNYMNQPVSIHFSAMDWTQHREFYFDDAGTKILFAEKPEDANLLRRFSHLTAGQAKLLTLKRGEPLSKIYPSRGRLDQWGNPTEESSPINILRQRYGSSGEAIVRK